MAVIMSAACFTGCDKKGEMRDMTTAEIVNDMGVGINLGNTFESSGMSLSSVQAYETGWGSPTITQKMIQGYADSGFGVLRVPVAWSNLMTGNYDIDHDYLARVTEVIGHLIPECTLSSISTGTAAGSHALPMKRTEMNVCTSMSASGLSFPTISRITAIISCSSPLMKMAAGKRYGTAAAVRAIRSCLSVS